MDGKIVRLVRERGFGFIRTSSGTEYFFHRSACCGTTRFDELTEGTQVRFENEDTQKGPRAVDVQEI